MSMYFSLAVSAVGVVGSAVGGVLAASGGDVAPWVSGGGAAAAVGGLAYIARQFASGQIVHLRIAEVIEADKRREERLVTIVEDGKEREDALRALLLARGR